MRGGINVPGVTGPDFLKVKTAAEKAATDATAAKTAAENAQTAAENAQTAADNALKTITKIANTIDAMPTQSGSLTYNGSAQEPSWNSYNPDTLTIGGETSGTDAGTYTATFTPKGDYQWSDGTNEAKEVTWTIGRATVALPTQSGSLTYTGAAQEPTWSGYDSGKMTIGGTTSGTNAGTYGATFTPTANYQWSDGTYTEKEAAWTIGRAEISTVPSQSGSLTYTGSALTPSWTDYDESKMSIGGTTVATNAGSYNATFTPAANYKWSDGSTAAKTVTWTIGKTAGSLSLSATSLSLTAAAPSGAITVTRDGDGAISASSNATGVAKVSVSGTAVTVTGVANGSATITINVAEGTNHTAPSSKTVDVTVSFVKIYGVSWDGTSTTAWSRTDDAASFTDPVPYVSGASSYGSPFDNCMPWSGMQKVEDSEAGTMVKIPKFWYKLEKNGNGLKIQIADQAVDGFSVSPAHMDRGDGKGERDVVYIGRYHCGASAYKSVSGQTPKVSVTRSGFRIKIHNLGSTIWQCDFAMRFTVWLLYLVEFADWNSQAKIGYGCGNDRGVQSMGASDSMPYHTGTMQSARTTYGVGTQYRYIEGLWDNVYDWLDGCYNNSNGLNIIMNPNNFSDSAKGINVGTPYSGYSSAFAVVSSAGFPMFRPSAANGSGSTYSCDYWGFFSSNECVCAGGDYDQHPGHGMFDLTHSSAWSSESNIGSRSMKLP